jgi:hypothetical protein
MTVISERQDVEKIEEINAIIADIKDKIKSRDFEILDSNQFTKPLKYLHLVVGDLNVYLLPVKSGIDGFFYHKDYKEFRAPFIAMNNVRLSKLMGIKFDDDAMAHELQHYLDYKKGIPKTLDNKTILKPEGGINKEYYNDPNEWSAYVVQILRQYFQKVRLQNMAEDFQTFYKDFFRKTYAPKYYQQLTDDNKKKFQKYLWQFHQKLIDKKHKNF